MSSTRKLLVVGCLLSAVSVKAFAADTLKVLFIGNSLTYTNDLPTLFSKLAGSGGRQVDVSSSAFPSYCLRDHCGNIITPDMIAKERWNIVVLQEQSDIPVIPYLRYHLMYPASRHLDSLIRKQGATTVFFMTWGNRYGGQATQLGYLSPIFKDFNDMQDSVQAAYVQIANELSARVAPVGMAWKTALAANAALDLWMTDGHPSLKGSYLAACTFYAVLFNASPLGLSYTGGLSPGDATFLQRQTALTVTSVDTKDRVYPASYNLLQNYPNPFNPATVISYQLLAGSFVKLSVFNVLGEEVGALVDEKQSIGTHTVQWSAAGMPSGIYLYRLMVGIASGGSNRVFVETRKAILLK